MEVGRQNYPTTNSSCSCQGLSGTWIPHALLENLVVVARILLLMAIPLLTLPNYTKIPTISYRIHFRAVRTLQKYEVGFRGVELQGNGRNRGGAQKAEYGMPV
jgi:hypothetical protein